MLIGILLLFVNTEGKEKEYYINRTTTRLLLADVFWKHSSPSN